MPIRCHTATSPPGASPSPLGPSLWPKLYGAQGSGGCLSSPFPMASCACCMAQEGFRRACPRTPSSGGSGFFSVPWLCLHDSGWANCDAIFCLRLKKLPHGGPIFISGCSSAFMARRTVGRGRFPTWVLGSVGMESAELRRFRVAWMSAATLFSFPRVSWAGSSLWVLLMEGRGCGGR